MDIVSIWLWIQIHAQELLLILTSTVTIASIIVKWTPTQSDDALLAKIMPWIEKIALNKKL